jgi:aspartyl-tRNA(Asn)/glutamyl-tRNA(Gln) amidotransferase subunit A
MVEHGFSLSGADIGAALAERARWTDRMVDFMDAYDVVVTPTLPATAFAAGIDNPQTVAGVPTPRFKWTPYTYGMNLTGQPTISVPCGLAADGLPVGLHIIGRRHEDATVLRVAAAFEALRPWHDLRPPMPPTGA